MVNWKIYYGSGLTVTNLQSPPEKVPGRNIICIVNRHSEVGKQIVTRHDYYWFDKIWTGGDIFGLFDYLLIPGWKKVLFGRTIETEEYEKIIKMALLDVDFPEKSARLPKENV